MHRCEIPGCMQEATHTHHIVYRSQGGPTIPANLIRLCPYHHNMSPEGVHQNPTLDRQLKRSVQQYYQTIFPEERIDVETAAKRLRMSTKKAEKFFRKTPKDPEGGMAAEDTIRRLMGGRIY